jgi:hypothetical protein
MSVYMWGWYVREKVQTRTHDGVSLVGELVLIAATATAIAALDLTMLQVLIAATATATAALDLTMLQVLIAATATDTAALEHCCGY